MINFPCLDDATGTRPPAPTWFPTWETRPRRRPRASLRSFQSGLACRSPRDPWAIRNLDILLKEVWPLFKDVFTAEQQKIKITSRTQI